MIIQRVIKGIGGISCHDAKNILHDGIFCNLWRNVGLSSTFDTLTRLTERNLDWHQNRYKTPDPLEGGQPFYKHTPFISTTAGTIERDPNLTLNIIKPAYLIALEFATDCWRRDGYLFYCYLFVLGKPTVQFCQFAEELRELNVYTRFSPNQPQGEITAKIIIPPTQIEKFAYYNIKSINNSFINNTLLIPDFEIFNPNIYKPPEALSNFRDILV